MKTLSEDWHERREKAIKLAEKYKHAEAQITLLRARVAVIAAELRELGYSLPQLLQKRQERLKNDNKNIRKGF